MGTLHAATADAAPGRATRVVAAAAVVAVDLGVGASAIAQAATDDAGALHAHGAAVGAGVAAGAAVCPIGVGVNALPAAVCLTRVAAYGAHAVLTERPQRAHVAAPTAMHHGHHRIDAVAATQDIGRRAGGGSAHSASAGLIL